MSTLKRLVSAYDKNGDKEYKAQLEKVKEFSVNFYKDFDFTLITHF